MLYKYGMRSRGYSWGGQPMDGLAYYEDSDSKEYHCYLIYRRKLTDKELLEFDMDFIGRVQE